MTAKVVGVSEDVKQLCPVYEVYLYNTSDPSGVSINYQLVSLGHTWVSPLSQLDVVDLSSFEELADEQGKLGKAKILTKFLTYLVLSCYYLLDTNMNSSVLLAKCKIIIKNHLYVCCRNILGICPSTP